MRRKLVRKIGTGLIIGLLCGFLIWLLSQVIFKEFFFQMEAQSYDRRMKLLTETTHKVIDDIVIVDVDERSVDKLGSFHQWPRTYWEKLIDYLSEDGVSSIGIDFIFDPDRRHPTDDQAFQRAIFESEKVCSALYFSQADAENYKPAMSSEPPGLDYHPFIYEVPEALFQKLIPQERLEPGDPAFLNASLTAGFVNLFPDPDGVLRRVPLLLRFNDHAYAAFAFQLALKKMGVKRIDFDEKSGKILLQSPSKQETAIPVDKAAQALIHYEGYFKSFRYISFYDVLMKFTPKGFFKDKIVIVGSSLPGLFDLRATPLQGSFPGVEVNANIVYQILNNKFISRMSDPGYFLLVLLVGLFSGIFLIFPRPFLSVMLTLLIVFGLMAAGLLILKGYSFWLPIIGPIVTSLLVFASTYIYRYSFEEKDKRRIRKVFSHYVSVPVVDVMLKHPEKVKLGGEKKYCTALFSDVAGFTTLSEQLDPESLVTLLNQYLGEMTNIILENRGMLDKYEGDAIMAVFGTPVEFPEHAVEACKSAVQMQKRLAEMRREWKKENKPELSARIGINSGDMVVGNMGSARRFDYTVMGDSVNLASRLEGANKLYSTEIMIGENTYELVKEDFFTRPLDLLRVKGKKKPVKVYELIALAEEGVDSQFSAMLDRYQKGFENYLKKNWELAQTHFRQALQLKGDDGPSRIYLLRCQEFLDNPPGEDWDGVFVMKTK